MAAAHAVARFVDTAVATGTSAASTSALAAVAPPSVEYASAVATDTLAATVSGLAKSAVGARAAVGMMSVANEKAKTPSGRVDDTGSDTSAIKAKGNLILLRGLVAVTAVALAAFIANTVMEGVDGGMVASPPCLTFLLGL